MVVNTLEEFEAEAARFARLLCDRYGGQASHATLVTLSGELGAGKTAFVKAIAKSFGIEEVVTSPTFVLEKIYSLPQSEQHSVLFKRLVHIDAYRLEQGSDLAPLGFDELMQDASNLVILEWPERVRDALPPATVAITLVAEPDGSRTLTYGEK